MITPGTRYVQSVEMMLTALITLKQWSIDDQPPLSSLNPTKTDVL